MTKIELLTKLIETHSKHSSEPKSNELSQLCTMWSVNTPPDILEGTAPLEEVCEIINMHIDEEYATELYDMNLQDAMESLYGFLASETII